MEDLHFHSYASYIGSFWVLAQLSGPHSGQGFQNEMLFFSKEFASDLANLRQ